MQITPFFRTIHAPVVTGVPPANPHRDFMKMPDEIPVSGSVRRRDHGYHIRKRGKVKALLQISQPLFFKPFQSKPPLPLPFPERKIRVYVIYNERKAVKLAETHLHLYKHKHPLAKRGSCN